MELTITSPVDASLIVDGVDLSKHVSRVELIAEVGSVPQLVLTMPRVKIAAESKTFVHLVFDPDTRDALLRLGWMAPPTPAPRPLTGPEVDGRSYFSDDSEQVLRDAGWIPGPEALTFEAAEEEWRQRVMKLAEPEADQ